MPVLRRRPPCRGGAPCNILPSGLTTTFLSNNRLMTKPDALGATDSDHHALTLVFGPHLAPSRLSEIMKACRTTTISRPSIDICALVMSRWKISLTLT